MLKQEGRASHFLAVDLETDSRCVLAGSDLNSRHPPWSTFKIPNFLIALETGAVEGTEHFIDWDPVNRPAERYWPQAWRQGQTLRTAFQRSVAWYFQEVAETVGSEAYRKRLDQWNYGNAEVPEGDDSFWLGGPLVISLEEQVDFLKRLLGSETDVPLANLAALSNVSADLRLESGVLHGKTGSGPVEPGNFGGVFEGWYVGWLRRSEAAPIVVGHYVRAERYADLRKFRRDAVPALLAECAF